MTLKSRSRTSTTKKRTAMKLQEPPKTPAPFPSSVPAVKTPEAIPGSEVPTTPTPGNTPTGTTTGTIKTPHTNPRATLAWASNKLRKPKGSQALLAPAMAAEIRKAAAAGTYRNDLGPHAPDPEALATSLEQASMYSEQEAQVKQQWAAVRDQRNNAWDQTLTGPVDTFQRCFKLAVEQNGDIEKEYPATAVFLKTASTIGVRAAATRKARKAAASTPTGGPR